MSRRTAPNSRVAEIAMRVESSDEEREENPVPITFGVQVTDQGIRFRQPGGPGQSMAICGDFNGWSMSATPMSFRAEAGVFEAVVALPPGRISISDCGGWSNASRSIQQFESSAGTGSAHQSPDRRRRKQGCMSRLRDDIDQLTARMTTPGVSAGIPSDIESAERPEILVLLMGHLPVRAGLWRLPTACFLLPDCQSIIVARQEHEDLFLECTGSSAAGIDESSLSMLEYLPSDSKVVIVPDSNIDADALAEMAPDRVALVTGGDQAAIVGAYSHLKNLKVDQDVAVELVIVGSEPDQVGDTATRLIDAASRHLDRQVRFVGAMERIEANTGLVASCTVADHSGGLLELVRRVPSWTCSAKNPE